MRDESQRNRGCQLATSFTPREVNALLELHRRLLRSDVNVTKLVTSAALLGVVRKFQAMAAKRAAFDDAQRTDVLASDGRAGAVGRPS